MNLVMIVSSFGSFSVLKLLNMKLELSKEKLKLNQFLFCLFCLIFLAYREQSLPILLSVFGVDGFYVQFHRLCYKTIGSCF